MATSEAKTRWPKTRCYVHDGSNEASKFSSFSSSPSSLPPYLSTSSPLEPDQKPDTPTKEQHRIISDYLSPYPNSSSDVPTGRQWWLNTEPNFAHRKDFTSSRQVSSEDEFVILTEEFVCKELQPKDRTENGRETRKRGLKAIDSEAVRDFWYLDDHLMELDSLNSLVSEESNKKVALDFESHWVGSDKTEPWWRSSGRDDLASLVAQKSLEIENCDLPRPRIYRKLTSSCSRSLDRDDLTASSLDRMAETGLSNLDNTLGSPNSEQTLRNDKTDGETSPGESDKSKDELLRALCLSQKRAREAERAAKQANTEKERVITLIFRQASHLFTYKQWVQLLQIEKLCLQIKNKNQPICDLFPSVLPWAARQPRKARHRASRKRHGKSMHEMGKCAAAFVLGLGLAGAGLLLGWTMGWLFPS